MTQHFTLLWANHRRSGKYSTTLLTDLSTKPVKNKALDALVAVFNQSDFQVSGSDITSLIFFRIE